MEHSLGEFIFTLSLNVNLPQAPNQMKTKERHSPRSFSRYDDDRDGRRRRSRSRSYERRRSRSPSYERRPRRSDSPKEWVLVTFHPFSSFHCFRFSNFLCDWYLISKIAEIESINFQLFAYTRYVMFLIDINSWTLKFSQQDWDEVSVLQQVNKLRALLIFPSSDLDPTVDIDEAEAMKMKSRLFYHLAIWSSYKHVCTIWNLCCIVFIRNVHPTRYRGPPREHHRAQNEPGSHSRSMSRSPSPSRSRPRGKKNQSRSHSPAGEFHPTSSSYNEPAGRSPSRSYSRSMSRSRSRSRSWAGRKSGGH